MSAKIDQSIVDAMYSRDRFSQWLGIELVSVSLEHCILYMIVREEMTNGLAVAHGGITYSLADSALAFASNMCGKRAMSIETSIAHMAVVKIGDRLEAVATQEHRSNRLARYSIRITNQSEELVAIFHGTVYISDREW